jgi:ubiquinone/menaquinone biosynthesis C-methylase UbiE
MSHEFEILTSEAIKVPAYLAETYWWAYVHPSAVKLFERQWLVNLILWGNFSRLRDRALARMGLSLPGRTLQVACVYGDLTSKVAARVPEGGGLDVVDVLPVQLENLARKLPAGAPVRMLHGDSTAIPAADATYDRALVFFLLHEQPEAARRATLAETFRVVKPGGSIVLVDYHAPVLLHPLRLLMQQVLTKLEPYALDLWRDEIAAWMPRGTALRIHKQLYFGGLYQVLEVTR